MTITGIKTRWRWFLINRVYSGTTHFEQKRKLLIKLGHNVGKGTKIVGPIYSTGCLDIGEDCWIGKNLTFNGNGTVRIGYNCDIAPEVTFQTGSHKIGTHEHRAGEGYNADITIGNGCWLGVRSTVVAGVSVGDGSVVAACACVTKSVSEDMLVGGIPAKVIKELKND